MEELEIFKKFLAEGEVKLTDDHKEKMLELSRELDGLVESNTNFFGDKMSDRDKLLAASSTLKKLAEF